MTEVPAVPVGGKTLLGESVEESRVKRLEKQQSRYRDRGGLFVPADSNPLLDVLLKRGVNGESPNKQRSMAPSPSSSPPRKARKSTAAAARAKKLKAQGVNGDASPAKAAKRTPAKRDPKPRSKVAVKSSKKTAVPEPDVQDEDAPIAGPSKLPTSSDGARKGKAQAKASGVYPPTVDAPVPKAACQKRPARPSMKGSVSRKPAQKKKSLSGRTQPTPDEPTQPTAGKGMPQKRRGKKVDSAVEPSAEVPEPLVRPAAPSIAGEKAGNVGRHNPGMTSSKSNLKRSAESETSAAIGAVNEQPMPSRHKRPKLYIPPDSDFEDDDDVPIVTTLKSKARSKVPQSNKVSKPPSVNIRAGRMAATSEKVSSPTSADPPPQVASDRQVSSSNTSKPSTIAQDDEEALAKGCKKSSSWAGTSKKATTKASTKPASDTVEDVQTGSSSKTKLSTTAEEKDSTDEITPKGRKKGTAKPAPSKVAKAPGRPTDDVPSEADAPPKGKNRTKAPAKRKGRDDHLFLAPIEDPSQADEETTRPAKRRKAAAADDHDSEKAKRLKSSSNQLKENRKATKVAKKAAPAKAIASKPKPRMSMFPVPDEIEDSEDEIDFLG